MHPRLFLETVAQPNASEFFKQDDSLRLAINAILTLDAFFGVMHAHLRSAGNTTIPENDDKFRDTIAAQHIEYRVLRDTAASIKHGALTHPKRNQPRLVDKPGQVSGRTTVLGETRLDVDPLEGTTLFIEEVTGHPSGWTTERVDDLIVETRKIAFDLLAQYGL